jgi:hypothetical protein
MNSIKNRLLIALLICGPLFSLAQPEVDLVALKEKYGKHKAVLLSHVLRYQIKVDGKGLSVNMDNNEQICHLEVKGNATPSDRVLYDPHFFIVKDLKANTWLPGEKGYIRKPVTEFEDVQSLQGDIFLDSRRFKEFRYPSVQSGAVTECSYSYEFLDPVSLGGFDFVSGVPLIYGEVSVTVSNDVELGIAQFGRTDNIEHTEVKKGSNTIHTWIVRNVDAFKQFDYLMSDDQFRPHLFVYVKSYTYKGEKVNLLGGVEDLYKYNYKHIKELSPTVEGELKEVVDSIKSKYSDETELVRGIYQWVQDNVRYIAMEEGLGGFVPRPANFVCEKKYGDCKDMANLLKRMLDYAGVPGYLCWVGTRSIGYQYDQLPLPNADNHMIAAYKKDGQYVFLDATAKDDPFGMPSWAIQGKQTMISIDENNFDVPFIPVVPHDQNRIHDELTVELSGNTLLINGKASLAGYMRSAVAGRVLGAGKQNEKQAWKSVLERASNKCSVESYTTENLEDRNKDLLVNYSLKIPDYAKVIADEMYVNMNLHTSLLDMKPDTTDRYCGVEFMHTILDESVYKLKIPDGYKLKQLPESLKVVSDKYEFDFSYVHVNSEIHVIKKFVLKELYIDPAEVKQWVADLGEVDKAFQQVVVLTKK